MTVLLCLFLALTLAAWVYSDAKDRGSAAPALWALIVFTGIGLPLYFAMRPSRSDMFKEKYLCPHCGRAYSQPRPFCQWCGEKIEVWEVNSLSASGRRYLCPHCGKFFAEPVNQCPFCGQNLHDLKEYKAS